MAPPPLNGVPPAPSIHLGRSSSRPHDTADGRHRRRPTSSRPTSASAASTPSRSKSKGSRQKSSRRDREKRGAEGKSSRHGSRSHSRCSSRRIDGRRSRRSDGDCFRASSHSHHSQHSHSQSRSSRSKSKSRRRRSDSAAKPRHESRNSRASSSGRYHGRDSGSGVGPPPAPGRPSSSSRPRRSRSRQGRNHHHTDFSKSDSKLAYGGDPGSHSHGRRRSLDETARLPPAPESYVSAADQVDELIAQAQRLHHMNRSSPKTQEEDDCYPDRHRRRPTARSPSPARKSFLPAHGSEDEEETVEEPKVVTRILSQLSRLHARSRSRSKSRDRSTATLTTAAESHGSSAATFKTGNHAPPPPPPPPRRLASTGAVMSSQSLPMVLRSKTPPPPPSQRRLSVPPPPSASVGTPPGASPPPPPPPPRRAPSRGSASRSRSPYNALALVAAPAPGESASPPPAATNQPQLLRHPSRSGQARTRPVVNMAYTDPYGDSGLYSGDVDDASRPHGRGKMKYDNGVFFEGNWIDGRKDESRGGPTGSDLLNNVTRERMLSGFTSWKGQVDDEGGGGGRGGGRFVYGMEWADRAGLTGKYTGRVDGNDEPDGRGVMRYEFGLVAEGEWSGGVLSGAGSMVPPGGMSVAPGGMSVAPGGMSVVPGGMSVVPGGMSVAPGMNASPSGLGVVSVGGGGGAMMGCYPPHVGHGAIVPAASYYNPGGTIAAGAGVPAVGWGTMNYAAEAADIGSVPMNITADQR